MQRLNGVTKVIAPAPKVGGVRSSSSAKLPLYEPLPGFENVKVVDVPLNPPQYQTSTLSNGIKVVTVANKHPVSSIGLFINAGSRHESADNAGATFFLRNMGFKSSKKLTPLRLTRSIELLGANYTIGCGREHMMFASEVISENVPELIPVIAEALHPALKEYEIREQREIVEEAVKEIESNPRSVLVDLLHSEAFRGKGLGHSLYSPAYNLHNLTSETLGKFVDTRFTPNNVILVGTGGVSHAELVKLAEKYISFGSRTASSTSTSPSKYRGGDIRMRGDFETHFLLGFEGAKLNSAEQYTVGVLQHILGGGAAHNIQGPGHGHASRLNRNVVEPNKNVIEEASAFNYNYSDSGLFGVFAIAKPGNVPRVADLLTKELSRVATGGINAEELARAKNLYKSNMLFNTESRLSLLDFVGRQTLTGAKETAPEQFVQGVESVTADSVAAAAKKIFKTKPTLVVLGDDRDAPTTDEIQAALKL